MVRLSTDPTTREYVARRQAEGKTKTEAMRCLKRYIAREVYTPYRKQPSVDSRSITYRWCFRRTFRRSFTASTTRVYRSTS